MKNTLSRFFYFALRGCKSRSYSVDGQEIWQKNTRKRLQKEGFLLFLQL